VILLDKDKKLSFRTREDLFEAFLRAAQEDGKSLSSWINDVVTKEVQQRPFFKTDNNRLPESYCRFAAENKFEVTWYAKFGYSKYQKKKLEEFRKTSKYERIIEDLVKMIQSMPKENLTYEVRI
jgi:uncharacterized membrane protein YheB (UPF0754 family)